MCGIFGAIRCGKDQSSEGYARLTYAFIALGIHSEERGKDSAGFAMLNPSLDRRRHCTPPSKDTAAASETTFGDVTIVKDKKPFQELPLRNWAVPITMSSILLGHTRAATQGKTDNLCNASPIVAGNIVGTHNGDVDAKSIPGYRYARDEAFGETDSEMILIALNNARGDRRAMTQVLRTVEGRAALAFIDRSRPERLYLARAALSPLCYAYDQDGNFYYASNPDWFRRVEADPEADITFSEITLIPEGHLLTVDTFTGIVEDVRRFTPVCREKDLRIMSISAYRGFRKEDKAADLALQRHRVVSPPLPKWPSLSAAPQVEAVTKEKGKGVPTTKAAPDKAGTPGTPAAAKPAQVSKTAPKSTIQPYTAKPKATPVFSDSPSEQVIDMWEVEELCWALGDFDHHTYERIMDADDETAERLVERLRIRVVEALGDSEPGWANLEPVA